MAGRPAQESCSRLATFAQFPSSFQLNDPFAVERVPRSPLPAPSPLLQHPRGAGRWVRGTADYPHAMADSES